ncbi:monovalent cation/H+ antiporter subunit E [Halovivax asiaticus JCM 14624]|uniref:Monovalent cation/H+ antiporter subunit E n=1 Tax=Halovivax asiaticus JCM 14624 TaxID=1227490 RepID=M0BTB6_9EURY|nr:monovalent cation/H+ antiporter subunit E [Halovivax asiaticus]ELZ14190.1 monovalent cation/H+ antiporter subunit E [Halovivax asiaticus JCM 14624]
MTDEAGGETTAGSALVLVTDSSTVEETVEYAARKVRELAAETDSRLTLTIGTPVVEDVPQTETPDFDALLETATDVAERATTLTDPEGAVDVETERIYRYRYPFDPYEYADVVQSYATEHGIDSVIVDPSHATPGTRPMTGSIADRLADQTTLDVDIAPVDRQTRPASIVTRGGLAQFLSVFGISLGFYLLVGGFADVTFDLVTGTIAALLVAGVLSRVTFERTPRPTRMVSSVFRWLVYVPYLGYKILVANFQIAYVVLHPSLPIDPSVERFEPGVWGGLPMATLANSITLTPGTLTVDVEDRAFVVHSLTAGAREDLLDGGLERAVRFVFYGRSALPYPSPRDRAESEGESS